MIERRDDATQLCKPLETPDRRVPRLTLPLQVVENVLPVVRSEGNGRIHPSSPSPPPLFREDLRQMPMVREGAFKYSSNAMYTFVFMLFWAIALLCGSRAALAGALFQHAYIWVHMYCTEKPDMELIYGNNP